MLADLEKALAQAAAVDAEFNGAFLYGEEAAIHQFLTQGLRRLAVSGQTVEIFDAEQVGVVDFLATGVAPSFFAPRKIIHLCNLDKYSRADQERLADWLQSKAAGSSVQALFLSARKFDGRSFFCARARKAGLQLIKCDQLKAPEVKQVLIQVLKRERIRMSAALLDDLISLHDANLPLLLNELEKMILYVGPEGRIDEEVIDQLGVDGGLGNIFSFCEAVAGRRPVKALQLLDKLLQARTELLFILSMLARQYRLLAQAYSLPRQELNPQNLARTLKIHPYAAKMLLPQLSGSSPEACRRAFQILRETDLALKSSPAAKRLVIEEAVLRLAGARAESPKSRR